MQGTDYTDEEHNQYSGALAHDEAVAVSVPRPGRRRGVGVPPRQRAQRREPAEAGRGDGGLRAAGEHDVGAAQADLVRGAVDAVVPRGAGRRDRVVGAQEADAGVDGDQRRRHVGYRERHAEGGDLAWPLGHEALNAGGELLDPADAGADDHAGAFQVNLRGSCCND